MVYQFNATLLGFNWAPKMFFYAVLPLTSALAALGLRTSVYVDDMLGASHPSQALVEVRMAVMAWCFNCWSLNWEKSVLIPQSSLRHGGFEVIVPQMSFGVPADKVRDIRNLALSLWNRETVRRISIAKIVGKILSIARAFRPSRRSPGLSFSTFNPGRWTSPLSAGETVSDCRNFLARTFCGFINTSCSLS